MDKVIGEIDGILITKIEHTTCGFSNLYDFVNFLYGMYKRKNIHELDCFIDKDHSPYKEEFPSFFNADSMTNFIIDTIVSPLNKEQFIRWMDFDKSKMDCLLNEPFFSEYINVRKILTHDRFNPNNYYVFLELYTYTKIQSIAVTHLPEERSITVWDFLCYEDIIEVLINNHFFESIASIYKKWGKDWFIHHKMSKLTVDPILYKWACYAIASCKYTNAVNKEKLKKDLTDIYSEFLILSVRSNSLDKNKIYLDYIQNDINHFDDFEIKSLKSEMDSLKHDQLKLLDDKKTIMEP